MSSLPDHRPGDDWASATGVLEAALEAAGRLLDGEDVQIPALPPLDLTTTPDPTTLDRTRRLMADLDEAMAALAERRDEVAAALEQTDRHRQAGRGYLRH